MASEIRQIDVNGARLGYEVHAENSGKPPLIFVHGYSGRSTGDLYKELLEALAHEFTIYALDARGHGSSADQYDTFSLIASGDDVGAFAEELGIVGAVFVGHSFGGLAGIYCGLRNPKALGALCLITPGDAAPNEYKAAQNFGEIYTALRDDPAAMEQALASMYVSKPELAVRHVAAVNEMNLAMHERWFREYPSLSILDDLQQLKMPVLFVNGGKDVAVPLSALRAMSERIEHCKEVTFMNQGHTVPLEAPELVAREIINFYKYDISSL